MKPHLSRFAPAKVNLFLEVTRRREDGFHEIVTVLETIAIGDRVTASPAPELRVQTNRPDVPDGPQNVAHRIILAAEFVLGRNLPAHVVIEKEIPPGSGLGAGSSDAVAALDLVLALHGVDLSADERRRIAAEVGSDTPFFVEGGLALCTGRGEIVQSLPQRRIRDYVIVLSTFSCATADVYRALALPAAHSPKDPANVLDRLNDAPGADPSRNGARPFNRLESAAEGAFPALAAQRDWLFRTAGREPTLSGSGGSFFFICHSQGEARSLAARLRAADSTLDVRATASYRLPRPA